MGFVQGKTKVKTEESVNGSSPNATLRAIDPAAIEQARLRGAKVGVVLWFASAAAMMGAVTSWSAGIIHVGVDLSAAASLALAAMHTREETSDRPVPIVVRVAVYGVM